MEVPQVLHMNEGMGDTSYAQNSLLQRKVIIRTKPIIKEAITNLYSRASPKCVTIGDFGCSSGPNTLFVISEVIKAVESMCRKMGHKSPEYQVFLNDLHSNDFNTIFKSLPSFQENLKQQNFGPCFFSGAPGSFYGRILPHKSLHFAYSSYSLHWLSQVPEGIESNKGSIYMSSTSSPSVLHAYHVQFQRDFSMFLKCRSEELLSGGRMVLTIQGRRSKDPSSKEGCFLWELLAIVLNQLVLEGVIDEEKVNSFNIPYYTPSQYEVKSEIEKEGSFVIDKLEVFEQHWDAYHNEFNPPEAFKDGGYNVAKCVRAVIEPLISSHFHFDKAIINDIFDRYKTIVNDRMEKEKTEFVNLIVSMIKNN